MKFDVGSLNNDIAALEGFYLRIASTLHLGVNHFALFKTKFLGPYDVIGPHARDSREYLKARIPKAWYVFKHQING